MFGTLPNDTNSTTVALQLLVNSSIAFIGNWHALLAVYVSWKMNNLPKSENSTNYCATDMAV